MYPPRIEPTVAGMKRRKPRVYPPPDIPTPTPCPSVAITRPLVLRGMESARRTLLEIQTKALPATSTKYTAAVCKKFWERMKPSQGVHEPYLGLGPAKFQKIEGKVRVDDGARDAPDHPADGEDQDVSLHKGPDRPAPLLYHGSPSRIPLPLVGPDINLPGGMGRMSSDCEFVSFVWRSCL